MSILSNIEDLLKEQGKTRKELCLYLGLLPSSFSAVISAAYTMHYAAIKTVWSWFKSFAGLCLMSAAAIALLNVGG